MQQIIQVLFQIFIMFKKLVKHKKMYYMICQYFRILSSGWKIRLFVSQGTNKQLCSAIGQSKRRKKRNTGKLLVIINCSFISLQNTSYSLIEIIHQVTMAKFLKNQHFIFCIF